MCCKPSWVARKQRSSRATTVQASLAFPVAICLWLMFSSVAQTLPTDGQAGNALFTEHIRPLLAAQCLACHNAQSKQSGLDLSSKEGLLRGGDRGPAVVPGDPSKSLLYQLVTHEQEPHMPYKGNKLPDDQLALIAEWIRIGATYEQPPGAPGSGGSNVPAALPSRTSPVAKAAELPGVKLFTEHVRPVLETRCLQCHGAAA